MGEGLTDDQREVLDGLTVLGDGWWRPMDFGASDGSHHSGTATRLIAKGWVERSDHLGGSLAGRRKTWRYRITHAGRSALLKREEDGQR